jgi:hypothetical protein
MSTLNKMWKENRTYLVMIVLLGILSFWLLPFLADMTSGQYYNSTSLVNTTVNITNSAPLVTRIILDTPINLRSYNTTYVYCNVTIFDFDNNTVFVNATFYEASAVNSGSQNDGNNHYTNTSCSRVTPQSQYMNYTCTFNVQYYADNSTTWICNVTALDFNVTHKDDWGMVPTYNVSNNATINPLVAIKMDSLLDYGEWQVGQISNDTVANITNAGNRPTNISVSGYGSTPSDGFAFICQFGTIILNEERYSNVNGTAFASMTPLTSADIMLSDYIIPQRISEQEDQVNSTFWKVRIPIGAGGVCNGKILFTASDSG